MKEQIRKLTGYAIGLFILKPLGLRFDKTHRGQHVLFSHVAANYAANGFKLDLPDNWMEKFKR